MPRKKNEAATQTDSGTVESAVTEKNQQKPVGGSYTVSQEFKQYTSFLLEGGIIIPVEDGKVTVASNKIVSKLREGGFIE